MLRWSQRNSKVRFALLSCAVMFAGLYVQRWTLPHYAAPMTGLVFLVFLPAMRALQVWQRRMNPEGIFLLRPVPILCLLAIAGPYPRPTLPGLEWFGIERAHILHRLHHQKDDTW